ncbi:RNA binding motif protein 12Bb [Danio aesculapii]|uniref:RNA binding motif protein 12Bb n=1 Tax=Danio aesculapii TaxID=1142201 RepID=UPI0024BF6263|nr:RNA binding motif protein 12Bb [Danio aesculapii]XP_056330836.1 RNA binding motif protein 12Bb [Danio aesculapii]
MAVVIRLQGLRVTAGSEDIRNFFTGLRIPDGGVHIIGGELEEAFIIFASDDDARRAMARSGGCIKGSPVNLLLSSKSEMQSVLEESTRRTELKNRVMYKEPVKRASVEQGPLPFSKDARPDVRRPDHPEMRGRPAPSTFNEARRQREGDAPERTEVYLKLTGMPFSATKDNVHSFFAGLKVDDILFLKNPRGMFSGNSMVRFTTKEDAIEGMKRDRQYMGPRYIQITRCTEEEWLKEGGLIIAPDIRKRPPVERARSRSPISYRSRSRSPSHEEYCIMFENLPPLVEKRDVRVFLQPVALKDDQIIIFSSKKDDKSKSAVVVFRNLTDYCAGLAHNKEMMYNKVVYVSPISKEKMVTLLESSIDARGEEKGSRRSAEASQSQRNTPDSQLRCLYVRNLPFDVRKVEIMDFFHGFALTEDRVILLRDERGAGLGEALVIFQTEKEAMTGQSLNGQRFLGSEVMLKCITMSQMAQFGVNDQPMVSPQERNFQDRNFQERNFQDRNFQERNFQERNFQERNFQERNFEERNFQRNEAFNDGPGFMNNQMPQGDFEMPPNMHQGYGGHEHFEPNFGGNNAFGPGPDGNGRQHYEPPDQQFDTPTCVKLANLPSQIRIEEIYDFCYGYRVIPGSASLLFDRNGAPKRSATIAFENHREALVAVRELNGRPIGTRKIQVFIL